MSISQADAAAAEGGTGTTFEPPPPPLPPAITTTALPDATAGTAYSFTIAVSQGTPPFSWTATGLPDGLTIGASTGTISGTTTDEGSFSIDVTVTDDNSLSAEAFYDLTVQPDVSTGSGTTIITDYQQYAPNNSRGVEGYILYDTNINAASTSNTPGGGFNTPAGNVVYVATTGTNVASGGGTTGAPYQTIAYAVAQVNAGVHGTTATILLRSSDLGTDEAVFRESFPQIAGTSKVLGIQAEKGAKVWIAGSDIFDSADWTYVAGSGWRYNNAYAPPITTATGTPLSDQVFVDGEPYVQKTAMPIGPGEFYVDSALQRLYLGEASGWSIGSHTIEVSTRGWVNGARGNRNTKNNLFIRGIGFKHWASDWQNDVYGSLMFGNTGTSSNQLLEYCTFAFSSANHVNFSKTNGMKVYQCVFQNAGGLIAHADIAPNLTIRYCRFERSNWELGYPIQPSGTGRVAGIKITLTANATVEWCLFRNCQANGLWLDVHCTNFTVDTNTFIDCRGYGFTCENGGGTVNYYVNNLHVRCGNSTYGNNDGFRFCGFPNLEVWNNTSLDNVGAGMSLFEYDWTYDTSTTSPADDGDTFNCRMQNNVFVMTSRSIKSVWYSQNFHPSPPSPNNYPSGVSLQVPAWRTEQMFSPDPYAADLTPQDDYNIFVRINNSRPFFKWATPTADWDPALDRAGQTAPIATSNGVLSGGSAPTINVQSQGGSSVKCETNSHAHTDNSGSDASRLSAWFPSASSGDYSWSALSSVPTQAYSATGATPPNAVCALLGISNGTAAKYGVYSHPWPVPA